jgi:ribonuclease PH
VLCTTLNAIVLALLSTPSIPLRTTVFAVECVIADGVATVHPSERERRRAKSRHVLGFDGNDGRVVFCESSGEFSVREWGDVVKVGGGDGSVKAIMRDEVGKLVVEMKGE